MSNENADTTSVKCAEIFRNNTGKYSFFCAHCNEQTTSGIDILRHIESHFNDPYQTVDQLNFDATEIEEKPLEDIWIKEGLIIDDVMLTHIDNKKPLKLESENNLKSVIKNNRMRKELNIDNDEQQDKITSKPYKCKLCSKRLMTEKLLKSHINMRHKPEQKCRKCKKSFQHSKLLSKHLRNIHEMPADLVYHSIFKCKPFKCDECDMPFKNRIILKMHLIEVHARIEFARDPLKCDLCGNWYGTAKKLEEHIAEIHANRKPFKCEICDLRMRKY